MRLFLIAVGVFFGATVGSADGGEITLLGEYKRHDVRVTSLCIEGHIVLVAHSDVGKGGGLQMLQLQHEVDGKLVPMQCHPGRGTDSPSVSDTDKVDPSEKK